MKCLPCLLIALCAWLLLSAQGEAPPASDTRDPTRDTAQVLDAALRDYAAARYEPALQALQAELAQRGDAAPAELRLDAALCALRLLRSRDAEELVAPLTDDARWAAEAAFVLGLAACQHAERAVVAAKLADAEPMAWAMATRAIQGAELQFRQVVALRPDWSEGVRNLERTLLRRRAIEAEREASKAPDAKKEDAPKPEPEPPKDQAESAPEVVIPEIAVAELTNKELLELQQRVREQQQLKVSGRQQRSQSGSRVGGHDW